MLKTTVRLAIGLCLGGLLCWVAVWRSDPHAVLDALLRANLNWLVIAFAVYAVNLAARAFRWWIILYDLVRPRFGWVLSALVIGYGLNVALPARLGELFRVELMKRRYGVARVWALGSIVLERLLDGLTVVTLLYVGLATAAVGHATDNSLLGVAGSGAALFSVILGGVIFFSGSGAESALRRWPSLQAQSAMLRHGFRVIRSWRILAVIAMTVVVYVPDTLSLWLVMKALGATLGPAEILTLVGAASLSTLMPSGPGFLGTYQLSFALTMEYFSRDPAIGTAGATLMQLAIFLPLAAIAGVLFVVTKAPPQAATPTREAAPR